MRECISFRERMAYFGYFTDFNPVSEFRRYQICSMRDIWNKRPRIDLVNGSVESTSIPRSKICSTLAHHVIASSNTTENSSSHLEFMLPLCAEHNKVVDSTLNSGVDCDDYPPILGLGPSSVALRREFTVYIIGLHEIARQIYQVKNRKPHLFPNIPTYLYLITFYMFVHDICCLCVLQHSSGRANLLLHLLDRVSVLFDKAFAVGLADQEQGRTKFEKELRDLVADAEKRFVDERRMWNSKFSE